MWSNSNAYHYSRGYPAHKSTSYHIAKNKLQKNDNIISSSIPKSESHKVLKITARKQNPVKNATHLTYRGVPQHNLTFIVENSHLCMNNSKIYSFIYIYSAPSEFEKRKRIRDTWGNDHIFHRFANESRIAFFIGRAENKNIMSRLKDESNNHNDMIVINHIDSYWDITHKSVTILKWLCSHCNAAKYYIKVDSDVLLNIFVLKPTVDTLLGESKRSFLCNTLYEYVKRNEVSKEQLSSDRYPEYCHGPTWVFTGDILNSLYSATFQVPYIGVEDAYTTGLLVRHAGNIVHVKPANIWKLFSGKYTVRSTSFYDKVQLESVFVSIPDTKLYGKVWDKIVKRLAGKSMQSIYSFYARYKKSKKTQATADAKKPKKTQATTDTKKSKKT